ncbi:MAG TPA: hypothetical protein ENI27_10170, partial [bacterium]|nr:hypothetical protein [bacterium]
MAESRTTKAGLEVVLPLALGLAGAPKGARLGLEDREARQLRGEARKDRAENRSFLRKSREFETEEMEYKRQFLDYRREMGEAMVKFTMSDGRDIQPAVDIFNNRYPGADLQVKKTKGKKGELRYDLTG